MREIFRVNSDEAITDAQRPCTIVYNSVVELKLKPLSYARPMEKEYRPPMYSLIVTVLIAGGLILLGLVVIAVFLVMLFDRDGGLYAIGPLCVAGAFLYIGSRSMRVAVRFLRGKPPLDEHWDRWLFWIWISRIM